MGHENNTESGMVLAGVVLLNLLAAAVVVAILSQTAANTKAIAAFEKRSQRYYETQASLSKAVSWLRANSTSIVDIFGRDNFYSNFDRNAVPTVGNNDNNGYFSVATLVKVNGTANSAILSSSADLALSSFPDGMNGNFTTMEEFNASQFGPGMVRITLFDAIPAVANQDFGDTDAGNPAPGTDFIPVFRIDAFSAVDRGTHLYAFVEGSLVTSSSAGFYGEDFVEMRQPCDSYDSSAGSYNSGGNRNANCSVGTAGNASLHQNEDIFGSLKAGGSIVTSSPFGGDVCADFSNGCPNTGEICEGNSCDLPALPSYKTFNTYCPGALTNINVARNATTRLTAGCYGNITMHSKGTLIIDDSSGPIYVNSLDPDGTVTILPGTGTIDLYLNSISNNRINGNQTLQAANGHPNQLQIHYLAAGNLIINGNSDIGAFISAPLADVTISGNADYFGGLIAKSITATGNGDLHYDESQQVTSLGDLRLKVNRVSQYYR